jgi:hypothetical protein
MINNTAAAMSLTPLNQKTREENNETIMQCQLLLKSEIWNYVYEHNNTSNKFNSFLYTFLNILKLFFQLNIEV